MEEPRRRLDEYGPGEMAIPEWRLLQKTGGDLAKQQGAEPGQFYNTITDEVANELNLVIVDILSGRARWGQEITSAGPICASMDARSNKSISGIDCSNCEYRVDTPWSVTAPERRQKCCLNYIVLGIDLDHEHMPVMLRMHGISALPARQLITQLKMNRKLKGEYYRATINVSSVEKNTPYGIAHAAHLKIAGFISDDVEAEELKVESKRLLGAPIPLPEGRPEEEVEPLGFTPIGTPFYSEEERDRLLAEEAGRKQPPPPAAKPKQSAAAKVKPLATEIEPPPGAEEPGEDVDLNF